MLPLIFWFLDMVSHFDFCSFIYFAAVLKWTFHSLKFPIITDPHWSPRVSRKAKSSLRKLWKHLLTFLEIITFYCIVWLEVWKATLKGDSLYVAFFFGCISNQKEIL